MSSEQTELHIVLVDPEIPQNTGNVGRTCLGLGATLHLVGRIGFSLSEKEIRRAGLDYWPHVRLRLHTAWEAFLAHLPVNANLYFFSKKATTSFWEARYTSPAYLIFGSESQGFPDEFYITYQEKLLRIPITNDIRSLNLATAVGVAAFEVCRQLRNSEVSNEC